MKVDVYYMIFRKKSKYTIIHSLNTNGKKDGTGLNIKVYIIVRMTIIEVSLIETRSNIILFYNPKHLCGWQIDQK